MRYKIQTDICSRKYDDCRAVIKIRRRLSRIRNNYYPINQHLFTKLKQTNEIKLKKHEIQKMKVLNLLCFY